MDLKEKIIEVLLDREPIPMSRRDLVSLFEIDRDSKKLFYQVIDTLVEEGELVYKRERFGLPEWMGYRKGVMMASQKSFYFCRPIRLVENDIFVAGRATKGAYDGDTVLLRLIRDQKEDGRKAEGVVERIIKRKTTTFFGTFQKTKSFGFVVPDDKRVKGDIFIPKNKMMGAKNGQKVIAKITKWPAEGRKAEGQVIEVVGNAMDPGIDIAEIIHRHQLPKGFPKKVVEEAKRFAELKNEETVGREDWRDALVFTIDGADAKDLDDAISIKRLPDNRFELGVHIADVAHYVHEYSQLDKEARMRGTSVYLVDRVIPMLPKHLSNGLCSLHPGVDRLTLSMIMTISPIGDVEDARVAETVIHSKARLVYTDVSDLIQHMDESKFDNEELIQALRDSAVLAGRLRRRRELRGSIDFNFDEAKVILDKRGFPVDVKKAERRIANRMIEEFMLLANETISERYYWLEIPFLYRIHETPDDEKIEAFVHFVNHFGITLKGRTDIHPKSLQQVMDKVMGKPEEAVVSMVMLRSLKKAKYSAKSEGHFGLAADYYSHFTSPIRRYPDLQIHRIIKEHLHGDMTPKRLKHYERLLTGVAETSSERERKAQDAERESVKLKMTEYMQQFLGETFEGVISGITGFGFYVALDNTVEGMVPLDTLDGSFEFNELKFCVEDPFSGKSYHMGDRVKILVAKTDLERRLIDFVLAD
jgi:ribonuclease R